MADMAEISSAAPRRARKERSRRDLLIGGAAAVGATALAGTSPAAAQSSTDDEYLWWMNKTGFDVPSDTWTPVPWDWYLLNTTAFTPHTDGYSCVMPSSAGGIYALVANIAWDNAFGPDGSPIAPPIHRKLARIPQVGMSGSGWDLVPTTAAATEVFYHPDLASRGDQHRLSDGTFGYQQQQVYIQCGYSTTMPAQRIWIEVYQNSGMTLRCRYDGSYAPGGGGYRQMFAVQAPSLMIGKIAEF